VSETAVARSSTRSRLAAFPLAEVSVVAVWLGAAFGLAAVTARVVDWFVMTDELYYERLAISVARTGSPLPAIHGELVPTVNQLYPLILSTVYHHGFVPHSLHSAHVLNAFVMTSAALPAFLIARHAFGSRGPAFIVALLSTIVPWLVLSSFLLTEVVAYPAFLWAVYAIQRCVAAPSARSDLLTLVAIGVAVTARTQFAVLLLAAPLAIVLHELTFVRTAPRAVPRSAAGAHRVLTVVLGAGLAVFVVLAALGKASSALGTYSATVSGGNLLPSGTLRSFTEHVATLALALGLLPFLLGTAWLLARVTRRTERRSLHASACVAVITLVLVLLEVTSFDLRFGGGLVRDRYLFYVAPLVLLGFVGALFEVRTPRWSLAAPGAILVAGLAALTFPTFEKLNVDAPAASLNDYLLQSGHGVTGARWTLVATLLLLLTVFFLGRAIVGRRVIALVLVVATVGALGGETAYAFDRLLRVNGTSGRPITLPQGIVFDWIDRTLGRNADVTIVPYAQIAGDYWATAAYWWDLEFWNVSVTRGAYPGNAFAEIQSTFPKTDLRFDPQTGRANVSPTRYVAQSQRESRFRLRGPTVSLTRDVLLIDAGSQWQADWVTFGLDDDGWTTPGRAARLRVYPAPGQTGPVTRGIQLVWQAAPSSATIHTTSNLGRWSVKAEQQGQQNVSVCVPSHGYAELHFRVDGSAGIYGDIGHKDLVGVARVRGALLARASMADEIGSRCTP
jgi:hypothetical protein